MRFVEPQVYLIAYPHLDWKVIRQFLKEVGGESWSDRVRRENFSPGEALVELGGRECYRSWEPKLNANVTKIREDSKEYLGNILKQKHGSVLEHSNYSFIFHNVSRVFTHEMVRHRAGVAVSQESMRYVRLTDIPFWFPTWACEDRELMDKAIELLYQMEDFQLWMADHFQINDESVPFSEKKHKTSFMRRFAPEGVATGMLCTMNIRALRHIIYMRTALGAEEEIRLVFDKVAEICQKTFPDLMQDYSPNEWREWIPEFVKV